MDMELGYHLDRARIIKKSRCKRESLTRSDPIVPGLLLKASKSV